MPRNGIGGKCPVPLRYSSYSKLSMIFAFFLDYARFTFYYERETGQRIPFTPHEMDIELPFPVDFRTLVGASAFFGCTGLSNAVFRGVSYSVVVNDLPHEFYDAVNGR